MDIPLEIEKAIKTKQFILFVGAGYSCSPPLKLPNWRDLVLFFIEEIKKESSAPFLEALKQAVISNIVNEVYALDVLKDNGYRQKCLDLLKGRIDINFDGIDLSKFSKLWEITNNIITTNYDCVLESSSIGITTFTYTDKEKVAKLYHTDRYLFKVHGTIKIPNECVLFRDTYENLYKQNKLAVKELSDIFSHKTILFVGFGLTDPYITDILADLQKLYEGNKGKHYVLTTKDEDFSQYDVQTIKLSGWHELDTYLEQLALYRKKINFSFEELTKELDAKGKEYDRDELEKKHENFLKEIYSLSDKEELTSYIESGEFGKAEELLSKSIEDKLNKIASDRKEAAQNAFNLASLKELQLEYKDVLRYAQQAYELDPENVIYLRVYCHSLMDSGAYPTAKEIIDKAIALPNLDEKDKMYFTNALGEYYLETGDFKKSLEMYSKLLNMSQNLYGVDNAITIGIYNSIGSSLRNLGRYRDAIKTYENAIHQLTNLTHTYPLEELALFYSNISVAWANVAWDDNFNKDSYRKSLWYAEECLKLRIEHAKDPERSMSVALAYNHAGVAIKRLGDNKKGIDYYNKALEIVKNVYSEHHPRYIDYSLNLAAALRADGKAHEAIEILIVTIEKAKKVYGTQHKKVGHIYINLGFSYADIKEFNKAVEHYEIGIPILSHYFVPQHPTMMSFLNDYQKLKDLAKK